MTYRAVDCQGFAGGFTLGTVQAGFELVGKREMKGGFGVTNCEANRQLLGTSWETESAPAETWSVPAGGADLVFGNPPCSGFSGFSPKSFRGEKSPINECMWAFADYAAKVNPQVAVFESVQAAYSQGRDLMRALRERLEYQTGDRWDLHHVKHNAYALGGPALRSRYFWVASRIPFGVEHPELPVLPTLWDAIGDLAMLAETWTTQPYRAPASPWAERLRSKLGVVDGHEPSRSAFAERVAQLIEMAGWAQGEVISEVTRRCYETHGEFPPGWKYREQRTVDSNYNFGFSGIKRWVEDQPARVITGAGTEIAIHPRLNRLFTHREVARIMGFPDDWRISPLRDLPGLKSTWGKGITVDAGRWISTWVRRSLDGEPGQLPGTVVGNREVELVVSKPRLRGTVGIDMRAKQKVGAA